MAKIVLADDGTLDTVLRCDDCNKEFRFTYAGYDYGDIKDDDEAYAAFVADMVNALKEEHVCNEKGDGNELD
jgi:hypothetical protein